MNQKIETVSIFFPTMKKYTLCKNPRVSSCFGQRANFFWTTHYDISFKILFKMRLTSILLFTHKGFLHEPLRCGWRAFPAHPWGFMNSFMYWEYSMHIIERPNACYTHFLESIYWMEVLAENNLSLNHSALVRPLVRHAFVKIAENGVMQLCVMQCEAHLMSCIRPC